MKLHIKNFRSIKQLDLEIAPITVLYGHNGTGKSSALYAPLTLKNIVVNPNQLVQEFFNYGFTRLGEFSEIIFDHNPNNELELGISLSRFYPSDEPQQIPDYSIVSNYGVTCRNDSTGSFQIEITSHPHDDGDGLYATVFSSTRPVTFPDYPEDYEILYVTESDKLFRWDGISAKEVTLNNGDERLGLGSRQISDEAANLLNLLTAQLCHVSFVPLGRGFFQPMYSLGYERNGSSITSVEQEAANLLANERHLEYAVSQRMEQILNKDFRIRNQIGSADFSLDSIDRHSRVAASLVNEGFGVNQLVHLLAKVLHSDAGIVCIEEPEIHLHPTAIRRLARTLADIVHEEPDKRLIISTHSEQFIMSFLALVADGTYSAEKLAIYHVTKEGKESEFHRQQVNENGQIEGGLSSFIEGELEDMKAFLGV